MSSTNFVDNVTVIEADWCNDVNDFVYKNDSQYNAGTFNVSESLCVGTNVATSPATVNGIIESQVGGFKFPDGTVQTTASTGSGSGTVTSIATGTGLTGGPITTTGTIALANTTVTAGTYTAANITVDAQGRITAAANGSGGGGGTVTSVGGTGTVSGLSLSGTVTTSGNLTLGGTLAVTPSNFESQTANTILAAPNGSAGTPTFRSIVAADIPTLNQDTTGNAATATYATSAGSATTATNVSGTVAIANGGTGQTTASAAFNALSPVTTTGDLIIGNGTNSVTRLPIGSNSYILTSNGTTASWQPNTGGGGGDGDVTGPASSTDNALVRFDSTTGKLIQNSAVTIDDDGNIISPDSIQFSGTIPATQPNGTFWFDSATNTFNLQQNAITQQVGEELFIYGKASATITEGQLIVKTGTVGASGTITFGPSPTGLTVNDGIIGVATENIASGSFGRITTYGIVHGLDTTGTSVGETWADNDTLYYNPSYAGGLTNVKPAAPNIKYEVATVIHAGSGGSGSIQVNLRPGSTLGGTDSNVQFGTINTNNLIQYDGTKWTNVTPASVTGIGSVANTLTVDNSGSGDASGSTYNGSAAKTISYNSIGAQPTLVSGTNIKTINGTSLLGSGDITISGGGSSLGLVRAISVNCILP